MLGLLEPNTRVTVALGHTMSAVEILAAERLRRWAFEYVKELFVNQSLTAIVSPTLPLSATELTTAARSLGESNTPLVVKMMQHIFMANFLGLPAISVPVGVDPSNDDMPVGLQLLGNHWEEANLLHLAHHLEGAVAVAGSSVRAPPAAVDLLADED